MESEKKPKKRGRKPKHIKKEDSKKGEKKKDFDPFGRFFGWKKDPFLGQKHLVFHTIKL